MKILEPDDLRHGEATLDQDTEQFEENRRLTFVEASGSASKSELKMTPELNGGNVDYNLTLDYSQQKRKKDLNNRLESP